MAVLKDLFNACAIQDYLPLLARTVEQSLWSLDSNLKSKQVIFKPSLWRVTAAGCNLSRAISFFNDHAAMQIGNN